MPRTDPVERIVEQALDQASITHSPAANGLDFFLPDHETYIECKSFFTPRIAEQMQRAENVIVIQGYLAARQFAAMINRWPAGKAFTGETEPEDDEIESIQEDAQAKAVDCWSHPSRVTNPWSETNHPRRHEIWAYAFRNAVARERGK